MNKPKDWWGNPENAQEWIKQNRRRTKAGNNKTNTTTQSTRIVINEIKSRVGDFENVLEIGAGDGRLIGELSKKNKFDCNSFDINEELCKYVTKKYQKVETDNNLDGIINLPYDNNTFDLVYTYQVLQHIHPNEIQKAVDELQRVAKKEVWCWEGIGRIPGYNHGDMTHQAHNGSFVWHINKLAKCYEVSIPKNNNIALDTLRLYKIKV